MAHLSSLNQNAVELAVLAVRPADGPLNIPDSLPAIDPIYENERAKALSPFESLLDRKARRNVGQSYCWPSRLKYLLGGK